MYLIDETRPISPIILDGHQDGAVLTSSPTITAGHTKAQVQLLACVVVAPQSLSLRVTISKIKFQ